MNEVVSARIFEQADRKMGLSGTGFSGLSSLLKRWLPGYQFSEWNLYSTAQIALVLPFDVTYDSGTLALNIVAPQPAFSERLQISVLFDTETSAHTVKAANVQGNLSPAPDGRMVWHVGVEWPKGLREGTAKVFYADEYIDDIKITRWRNTTSLRSAVDDYFDREGKNLRTVLSKGGAQQFECAMLRILNRCGIPAGPYISGVDQNRPDRAAVCDLPDGEKPRVLLIECTIEKVADKFTPLINRARALQEELGNEAAVQPVVFLRGTASDHDVEIAARHGIWLADIPVIDRLLGLTTAMPTLKQVEDTLSRTT